MMMSEELIAQGFNRVARDDRLLDVFTKETPEKGVELWEKWGDEAIEIVRIHNGKQSKHTFSRSSVVDSLTENHMLLLQ